MERNNPMMGRSRTLSMLSALLAFGSSVVPMVHQQAPLTKFNFQRVIGRSRTPGKPFSSDKSMASRYYRRYSHALTEYDTGRNKGTASSRKRERKQVAKDVKALNKAQTSILQDAARCGVTADHRRGVMRTLSAWRLAH